jgi:predicted cupin superfamily sugar epimerase
MVDLRDSATPAGAVVHALGLLAHPEGGHYRETWRDRPADGGRGAGTAILFLLAEGEISHWHRVDAAELWIWQAGAPLRLEASADGRDVSVLTLGPLLGEGHELHGLVPPGAWQSAHSLGAWTLVTCTVSPAFRFEGFDLAPAGWRPG